MSADVDIDDDTDTVTLDIDDFVTKFETWYRDDGGHMNPYDATEQFIDYYANKRLYLPFAKRKLFIVYILNISFIGIIAMTLASFITIFISVLSDNMIVMVVFISVTFTMMMIYIVTRIILHLMSKRESDISVVVINYKTALTDVICPFGSLADFINSITKQRPSKEDESTSDSSDL